jgi:hypothetical protein
MLHVKRLGLVCATACLSIALCASTAYAQSDRRFGFVIAYPTSVGVQWQAADRLTVRWDGSYRHSTLDSSTSTPAPFSVPGLPNVSRVPVFEIRSSTSTTGAELGMSVMLDVHRSDELRLYIAPRLAVLISKNEIETSITGLSPADLAALTFPANRETTSHSPSGGVALGVSHDVSPRIRIFGEAGVNYSRSTMDGIPINEITQSSFGVRSGVGVVVLF